MLIVDYMVVMTKFSKIKLSVTRRRGMGTLLSEPYIVIGLIIGIIITVFGFVWTILERMLLVSRKHVTGVSGFTSIMFGVVICAGTAYYKSESILYFILTLAVIIVIYVIVCCIVKKKHYSPEERYTKE